MDNRQLTVDTPLNIKGDQCTFGFARLLFRSSSLRAGFLQAKPKTTKQNTIS